MEKLKKGGGGEGWERAPQFPRAVWLLTAARKTGVRGEEELPGSRQRCLFSEAEILGPIPEGQHEKGAKEGDPLSRNVEVQQGVVREGEMK